jgi:hypothetical protein
MIAIFTYQYSQLGFILKFKGDYSWPYFRNSYKGLWLRPGWRAYVIYTNIG